jgi:hypothetical protein
MVTTRSIELSINPPLDRKSRRIELFFFDDFVKLPRLRA